MTIRIEATTYTVCGLPEDNVDASIWTIRIERRGPDSWAACCLSRCLSSRGKWDYEPNPSSRTKAWLARHRFTLEQATELAIEAYPKLVFNGWRVEAGELVRA